MADNEKLLGALIDSIGDLRTDIKDLVGSVNQQQTSIALLVKDQESTERWKQYQRKKIDDMEVTLREHSTILMNHKESSELIEDLKSATSEHKKVIDHLQGKDKTRSRWIDRILYSALRAIVPAAVALITTAAINFSAEISKFFS